MRKHIGWMIGVSIGIVGLGFTWYGLKTQKPVYAITGANLVSGSLDKYGDLKAFFEGKEVPQVTVTYIAFANDGRQAIRRSDIATTDPLRIYTRNGAKILRCTLDGVSDKRIGASVTPIAGGVRLAFEFLRPHDWIRIRVVHTGNKAKDCQLRGMIIDAGDVRSIGVPDRSSRFMMIVTLAWWGSLGVLSLLDRRFHWSTTVLTPCEGRIRMRLYFFVSIGLFILVGCGLFAAISAMLPVSAAVSALK